KKGLIKNHQNIYWYSKTNQYIFNTLYQSYSPTTNVDQILQRRTRNDENKAVYDLDNEGNFINNGRKKGVALGDVWEIPYLNPKAKERVGYPTQKPVLLIEKLLTVFSNEDSLILDPFCGSGTTCVAAKLNRRNYIGIDQNPAAIEIAKKRIAAPIKTESDLLKKGKDSYKKKDNFLLELLRNIPHHPIPRNKGIDAILVEQFENAPVLVRIQREDETLAEAITSLENAMVKKQSKKSILIQVRDASYVPPIQSNVCVIQHPSLQIKKLLS
ncbi:MAG: site-specific DNA-methyltransferase, partial [Myxococcota bacterium]|nr:site-specific DNA-methyltransferase [Myxococcota bacterium]